MNIIANDCVGGFLYKAYGEVYKSPFVWSVLVYKDFVKLLKQYDKIDFSKVKYNETPNYLFPWYMSQLVVDNKITIYFPHHVKDKKYTEFQTLNLVKNQSLVGYAKMDEYLLEHYKKRVERMIETPVFVYSQENRNTEKELLELLKTAKEHNRNLIFITSNKELIKDYLDVPTFRFLLKEKNEIKQEIQAEGIKKSFNNYLEQIWKIN